jgi:hypothetical protein
MLQYVFIAHYFNSGAPNPELNTALVLGGVWFKELKFNKHCSTFVLFDKKFPILD